MAAIMKKSTRTMSSGSRSGGGWSTRLKRKHDFLGRAAMEVLEAVFGGIEGMSTDSGAPLVAEAGPSLPLQEVWRARAFQSKKELKAALAEPDRQLGPPRGRKAQAGRMNAAGISVFYGARSPDVALAEVRPLVGSYVVVARFEIVRKLRILDLAALGEVSETGSVFDETLAPRMERASFLRSLSRRITRPVMPDDSTLDYLPTQAIGDYLTNVREPRLDGIAFPSSQDGGRRGQCGPVAPCVECRAEGRDGWNVLVTGGWRLVTMTARSLCGLM